MTCSCNCHYSFYFEVEIVVINRQLYFYLETPDRISACCLATCRSPVRHIDCSSDTEADHERSSAGCVCAPSWPPLGLRLPVLFLAVLDPASWPGGPGRPLRRPPVRLGLHGHHLYPQAGGGTAVLQRFLGQRWTGGL